MHLVLMIVIFLLTSNCESLSKRFVSSWDLSNKKNWKNGVTPCAGRSVKFQTTPDFSILNNEKTILKSIDISYDLEIIFGENSTLELQNEMDNTCKGHETESVFENRAKGYWWDPASWRCEKEGIYGCNSAVPHILRVPCEADSVLFPNVNESSYNVIFSDPIPTVKSLFIGKKNVSTSTFFEFSVSTEGERRITKRFSSRSNSLTPVYIETEGLCSDITGCLCHARTPVKEICKHMTNNCPKVTCNSPLKMKGFCCEICGAEITITHNTTIPLTLVETLLQGVLKQEEGKGVNGFASKMSDDLLHVYFVPEDDTFDYTSVVSIFLELFSRDLNTNGLHHVSSYLAKGTLAEKISREKNQRSYLTAIFVSMFIVFGIVFAVYLFMKRRSNDLPFMFRRMSLRSMSMRSSRSTSIPSSAHVAAFSSSDGRSFINPTFGEDRIQSFPSLPVLDENITDTKEGEGRSERENPLYEVQMGQGISFKTLKSSEVKEEQIADVNTEETKPSEESSKDATENVVPASESADVERKDELINIEDDDNQNDQTPTGESDTDPIELLAKSRIESAHSGGVEIEGNKELDNEDPTEVIVEKENIPFTDDSVLSFEELDLTHTFE